MAKQRKGIWERKEPKTYYCWQNIKARCYGTWHPRYKDWGGRGITMCEAWRNSFEAFLRDMGICPNGASIQRIDNDGDYEPGNCKWVMTRSEQQRNRRNNRLLTFSGRTQCLAAWSEEIGIDVRTLNWRLDYGRWPLRQALTIPAGVRR